MNALIRKEARLLLPSFVIGLALASSIWLIPDEPAPASSFRASVGGIMSLFSPVLLVTMALGSFGRELSAGTFSFLLAQPVSRSRVWWTKTLLLAAAVGLIWAAWWFSLSHNVNFLAQRREDRREAFLITAMFVIAAYSGGLWTTLLFRQWAAAFWFTLLTPAALAMAVVAVVYKRMGTVSPALEPALIMAFSIYGVAGFLFARWLFLRAQDTQWTGGEIALPDVRGKVGWFAQRGVQRRRRPCAALWMKELKLHQLQFVLAGGLALLHLVVLALRKLGGDFKDSSELQFLLEHFWVLWLAMPLMVGCAAVAEERKLGTLEGQLCLPSPRRTQFVIKFATLLVLSLLLGVAMPLLLEGARILPNFDGQFGNDASNYAPTAPGGTIIPIGHIVAMVQATLPFLSLTGIATAVAIISFYASTLTRSAMQALVPALVGIPTAWFLIFAGSEIEQVVRYPLWHGGLIFLFGVPMMTVIVAGLMFWNFKRVLVDGPVWRPNLIAMLAALGCVTAVTSATYHRVWEHFMRLEPPHGAARLPRSVSLSDDNFSIAVQFPDGRNWSSRLTVTMPDWASMLTGTRETTAMPGTSGYLEGSNWLSVTRSYRDTLGIRKDGSLWVSERPEQLPVTGLFRPSPNPQMIPLGQNSDWKIVTARGSSAFLLKTNGTLWRLGTSRGSWKNWPGFAAFAPERLGTDSDWAGIFRADYGGLVFQKADGRVWLFAWHAPDPGDPDLIRLDADISLKRAPYLDGQKSIASTWTSGPPRRNLRLGVGKDGVLRIIAHWGFLSRAGGSQQNEGFISQSIPLGNETNWLAVADNQYRRYDVVALRTDGTLWKLSFPTDPITEPKGFTATPFSRHTDWVALMGTLDGMIAVASDGALWFWAMEERYSPGLTLQPLLAVSRRPQLISNLFEPPTR